MSSDDDDDALLDSMFDATELKKLGNDAFAAKNYPAAIAHYSSALGVQCAEPHVLLSNR